MKAITMILLALFMSKSCSQHEKNDLDKAEIMYSAVSRGMYEKITIKNQKIYISRNRKIESIGDPNKISKSDWNELISCFETIELDSLSTYKDPTQKRFYDGAPIADLKITFKDKNYQSRSFDHGHPPVEIEKMVNKIVSLAKEKK